MTKEDALGMVAIHGSLIQNLDEEYKSDPDVVLKALANCSAIGDVILYIPRKVLMEDRVAKVVLNMVVAESDDPFRDINIFLGNDVGDSLVYRRFFMLGIIKECSKSFM